MNFAEIIKLFKDFQRYDNSVSGNASKIERFSRYLTKLQAICTVLQAFIANNDIENIDDMPLTKHDIALLGKTATYYFKLEKRDSVKTSA